MESEPNYDYLLKLVIVGDFGVGKSSILLRFTDDIYANKFRLPVIVDFKIKTIILDENILKLEIWDTGGLEKFKTITTSFYRDAHGIMLVYDITNAESFDNVQKWLDDIDKYTNNCMVKILIGNKLDMAWDRNVSIDKAQSFADLFDMDFIEVSAKYSLNIDSAFIQLLNKIQENRCLLNTEYQETVDIASTCNDCKC